MRLESHASRHKNAIIKELVPTPIQYGLAELWWVGSGLAGSPARGSSVPSSPTPGAVARSAPAQLTQGIRDKGRIRHPPSAFSQRVSSLILLTILALVTSGPDDTFLTEDPTDACHSPRHRPIGVLVEEVRTIVQLFLV